MRSGSYATVVRPSVRLSVRLSHPAAARRCCRFAAVGPAAIVVDIDRLLHGAQQEMRAVPRFQHPQKAKRRLASTKCTRSLCL